MPTALPRHGGAGGVCCVTRIARTGPASALKTTLEGELAVEKESIVGFGAGQCRQRGGVSVKR